MAMTKAGMRAGCELLKAKGEGKKEKTKRILIDEIFYNVYQKKLDFYYDFYSKF